VDQATQHNRRRRRRTCRAVRGRLAWLLCLTLALTSCARGGAGPETSGSPTNTSTPSGDVLRVDGQVVRQALIPDLGQGPVYYLTDQALFTREHGVWTPTGAGNDGRVLLADPRDAERLLRGDHPPCRPLTGAKPRQLLQISDDGGHSWVTLPAGENVRPLAFDPSLPDTIYGSDCALTVSTDAGQTWDHVPLMVGYEVVALEFVGQQLLALGSSPEGKSRLRRIDLSDPLVPVPRETLLELPGGACLAADQDRIVVGGRHGVYVSDDGGATWTSSRNGLETVTDAQEQLPTAAVNAPDSAVAELGILAVALAPGNKRLLFAGTVGGLYISQDGGVSWDRYTEIGEHARVTSIQFALGGADIYVTTQYGIVDVPNPTP
jgi:photosystem II stability/assembly factor-like uncharacterized protein